MTYEGDDSIAFVISANIHRRHLTPAQKRPATVELVKRSAERSNALLAEWAGVDDHEIADIRAELESTSEIPRFEKTTGKDGKGNKGGSGKDDGSSDSGHTDGGGKDGHNKGLTGVVEGMRTVHSSAVCEPVRTQCDSTGRLPDTMPQRSIGIDIPSIWMKTTPSSSGSGRARSARRASSQASAFRR